MSRIFGQMFTASELSALPQGTNGGDMLRTAKNIGQRLLKTRDALGLSQAEFCRTIDVATKIRDRHGISLDWINLADQRSSTLCAKPRSSSRAGDDTTTQSGPTPQSDTSHQHQRCSCLHSPRGRLRYADWLRRPRWRN